MPWEISTGCLCLFACLILLRLDILTRTYIVHSHDRPCLCVNRAEQRTPSIFTRLIQYIHATDTACVSTEQNIQLANTQHIHPTDTSWLLIKITRPLAIMAPHKGNKCNFAHTVDPTFKRKACPYFSKGTCWRGDGCNFSHEQEDTVSTNGATKNGTGNSEAIMKDFRWKIPKETTKSKPLPLRQLGKFFQQALELIGGDIGAMQEVITLQ